MGSAADTDKMTDRLTKWQKPDKMTGWRAGPWLLKNFKNYLPIIKIFSFNDITVAISPQRPILERFSGKGDRESSRCRKRKDGV